jgi:hypothetical protein
MGILTTARIAIAKKKTGPQQNDNWLTRFKQLSNLLTTGRQK